MFRGKTLNEGVSKWVEGYYIVMDIKHYIYDGSVLHEVASDTVGAYRGYADKNGIKIFEGDIHKNRQSCYVVLLGYFLNAANDVLMYGWHIKSKQNKCYAIDGSEADSMNIVGNIFDNADLLKGYS